MIITANAKRYAKALFELALEKNLVDEVHHDFNNFLTLVNDSSDLQSFLKQPMDQERQKLISELLKDRFSEMFFNFQMLVLKNKRFHLFEQMFEEFEKQVDSLKNRVSAVAITAFPLPAAALASMSREIASYLHADVRLENEVDPAIIGGIILRVEDKIFNASLLEQFKKLKTHLNQNQK
ncbi:MAG TPA: ATP synthase F1 subunit delta [bacterium]